MDRREALAGLAGAAGGVAIGAGRAPAEAPKPADPGPLKLGAVVGVVCDHTMAEQAVATRAMLEGFQARVNLHRLVQRREAEAFFADEARAYDHLVICCHGSSGAADPRIKLEVVEPRKGDPELGDMVEFALRPASIPDQLRGFRGTVVSRACGSGREPFGAAFLKAGCRAYLAPTGYVDMNSGLLFVAGFFYFLLAGGRPPEKVQWTAKEAAAAAARFDGRSKFGTNLYRLFERG